MPWPWRIWPTNSRSCYAPTASKTCDTPAYSDAHLTHARALAEFLVGRKSGRRDNDVKPAEIAQGWKPPDSGAVGRLRKRLTDMDQHLAHITWTRAAWKVNPPGPWNFEEPNEDFIKTFTDFATFACDGRLPGWEKLDRCMNETKQWR